MLQLLFALQIWHRYRIPNNHVHCWTLSIEHIPFHGGKLRTIENSNNNQTTDGRDTLSFHMEHEPYKVNQVNRVLFDLKNSIEIFLPFCHSKCFDCQNDDWFERPCRLSIPVHSVRQLITQIRHKMQQFPPKWRLRQIYLKKMRLMCMYYIGIFGFTNKPHQ